MWWRFYFVMKIDSFDAQFALFSSQSFVNAHDGVKRRGFVDDVSKDFTLLFYRLWFRNPGSEPAQAREGHGVRFAENARLDVDQRFSVAA